LTERDGVFFISNAALDRMLVRPSRPDHQMLESAQAKGRIMSPSASIAFAGTSFAGSRYGKIHSSSRGLKGWTARFLAGAATRK
jgi:hypothetical protein